MVNYKEWGEMFGLTAIGSVMGIIALLFAEYGTPSSLTGFGWGALQLLVFWLFICIAGVAITYRLKNKPSAGAAGDSHD